MKFVILDIQIDFTYFINLLSGTSEATSKWLHPRAQQILSHSRFVHLTDELTVSDLFTSNDKINVRIVLCSL